MLTGHSHSFERSYLLDGHYGTSSTFSSAYQIDAGDGRTDGAGAYAKSSGSIPHEGAVYSVVGSSSQISGGSLNHPAMFISLNEAGSMVLDIDGQTLNAKFINSSGVVRDHFTITMPGAPTSCGLLWGGTILATSTGAKTIILNAAGMAMWYRVGSMARWPTTGC